MRRETAEKLARELMFIHGREARRLERLSDALRPWSGNLASRVVSKNGVLGDPESQIARRAQTNFLPLVLDVFSQSMKVVGYYGSQDKDSGRPWRWWQVNQMDARQTGMHRAVLQYGYAYCTVTPGVTPHAEYTGDDVVIQGVSPRRMTALYGERLSRSGATPVDDDFPEVAVEVHGDSLRVYDEENVYFFGVQETPLFDRQWVDSAYLRPTNFQFIEARPHNVGACPVVRFRDRQLLDGEEQLGIIEPLLTIQERLDETNYEMLVAQYFAAFKQRYVLGWTPKSEEEALRTSASNVWIFNHPDTKVGQFEATDIRPYLDSKASTIMEMAAIAQIPPQNLGSTSVSNISAEGLDSLENARAAKSAEITTSLGESWEQVLRTAAHIEGDTESARDFSSEVRWMDSTARSFAQQVDGLGKIATMLHVPPEVLWGMIPGWDRGMVERALQAAKDSPYRVDGGYEW